jgi:hypothetical protein
MFENWEKVHAAKDSKGNTERLHIFDDEHITMITGRYDHEGICQLCLHKNNGGKLEFGKEQGTEFNLSIPSGKKVIAFAGQFGHDRLHHFGVYYI